MNLNSKVKVKCTLNKSYFKHKGIQLVKCVFMADVILEIVAWWCEDDSQCFRGRI